MQAHGIALVGVVVLSSWMPASPSRASEGPSAIRSLGELREACDREARPGRRALYAIEVGPRGFRFAPYQAGEGVLPVDLGRNLRALGGAVELFPTGLESVGFSVPPERARALIAARRAGSRLRVGFFLGFDNPHANVCLVRPAAAVSTVRMDLAFVELLDPRGKRLARDETERFIAWLEEREREAIEGSGPRAAIRRVTVPPGAEAWKRVAEQTPSGALGEALSACHAESVAHDGERRGQVVVRVTAEPRSGSVRQVTVELSSVDRDNAECVARSLHRSLALPPAPMLEAYETVEARMSVLLVAD